MNFVAQLLIMAAEYITIDHLNKFKIELIGEFRKLLGNNQPQSTPWLKGKEVRKLLNISPNTLQKLRIEGTISFNKVGGSLYYKYEDIQRVMDGQVKAK